MVGSIILIYLLIAAFASYKAAKLIPDEDAAPLIIAGLIWPVIIYVMFRGPKE